MRRCFLEFQKSILFLEVNGDRRTKEESDNAFVRASAAVDDVAFSLARLVATCFRCEFASRKGPPPLELAKELCTRSGTRGKGRREGEREGGGGRGSNFVLVEDLSKTASSAAPLLPRFRCCVLRLRAPGGRGRQQRWQHSVSK